LKKYLKENKMIRFVVGFLVIAIFVAGCTSLKKEESLAPFTFKTYKVESAGGCSDSVACATFEVVYPVFPEMNEKVSAELLRLINNQIEGDEGKVLEQKGMDFILSFKKFQTEMPDNELGWSSSTDVSVLVYSDSLISLQVETDAFTGGAHGSHVVRYINIDPATGHPYLLDSFLRPGYAEFLREEGEAEFRNERELEPGVSLEEAGFSFPNNQFSLNENYGFRKEGIVFFYNGYEVAAYADGPTAIVIPYEKLAGWYK
jgi:hypothetical protein